jgi:predicted DNA-binding transcriptional regulator AlpA
MNLNEPELLNLTKLCKVLGIGRTTIYEWLYNEQLPKHAKFINGRRYWTKTQIEQFLSGGNKSNK